MTTRFVFKFCALLDPRVNKRVRMRSHNMKKVTTTSDVQMDTVQLAHQPLTALEQWKASRHRLLWVAVGICTASKWTALDHSACSYRGCFTANTFSNLNNRELQRLISW